MPALRFLPDQDVKTRSIQYQVAHALALLKQQQPNASLGRWLD